MIPWGKFPTCLFSPRGRIAAATRKCARRRGASRGGGLGCRWCEGGDRMSSPAIHTEHDNLAELITLLGGVPLERIRTHPAPGTATEADVAATRQAPERRLCELIDGVLVEKAVGARESLLAAILVQLIWNHVEAHGLGIVLGADGAL